MGLFSFLNKNKQDSSAQDSGRFSSGDDDAIVQRARAKRASHAGEGARRGRGVDPVLPEKKRARRRLVGAIALALAAAVGLPMLLDSEPKPLAGDIAIHIPSKEKAAALPPPSAPVPAEDSVDGDEEIVETPLAAEPAQVVRAEPPRTDSARHEPVKPPPAPEPKAPARVEPKSEPKVAEKSAPKPARLEDKPVHAARGDDAARALAILEGKPAVTPAAASQKFVVQVAALASPEKVAELQARLRAAGVSSYTQKSGELIRVRVGPFGSREEAEKVRAKLSGLGLSGTMVPV